MDSASHFALVTLLSDSCFWHPALHLLVESRAYAVASRQPIGEFAVKVQELEDVGLAEKQIRALVEGNFLEPASGGMHHRAQGRNGQGGKRALSKVTPLVLSDAGVGIARDVYLRLAELEKVPEIAKVLYTHLVAMGEILQWDGSRRQLWFRHQQLKRFGVRAPHQEGLLSGFQKQEWRRRLKGPALSMNGANGEGPGKPLRDAIYGLNVVLKPRGLHLQLDGTGGGVSWEIILPGAPPRSSDRTDENARRRAACPVQTPG
jgi:hypothetical protein